MTDTKEPTSFPTLSQSTLSPSGTPSSYPSQHDSYKSYLRGAVGAFPDTETIKDVLRLDLERDRHNTAVYSLDIGEFTEQTGYFSVCGRGPVKGNKGIEDLVRSSPAGTKLRVLLCFHGGIRSDQAIPQDMATFYDINPRMLQEHYLRYAFIDKNVYKLPIKDACPVYLPSEAHFSPIEFERAVWTRQKKTTIMLVSNPTQSFKTVLVLVSSDSEFYSANVLNRDIIQPSVYLPLESLKGWRLPQNEAETCFLRLSRQSSIELEACVSQPILTVLPLVRGYCLETSQDIFQLQNHINRFGLADAGQDDTNGITVKPETHWGSREMDPFKAFQIVNAAFTRSHRSLNDHLAAPWLDCTKPHMEIAHNAISSAMLDTRRVQDVVMELREVLKETSALVSAQESIFEARRSVAQAESVNQLTRLAFIFIPLTFATSVFGMNINEWQDNVPHLKWFFIIALCCTSFTILSALLMSKLSPYFRAWAKEHHGYGRACWYFVLSYTIAALTYVFIAIPTKIRDYRNPELRRIRREQKRQAKQNMV
ncbi:hypothetical protein TWF730_010894 [Orbilia blumenaviensis]